MKKMTNHPPSPINNDRTSTFLIIIYFIVLKCWQCQAGRERVYALSVQRPQPPQRKPIEYRKRKTVEEQWPLSLLCCKEF